MGNTSTNILPLASYAASTSSLPTVVTNNLPALTNNISIINPMTMMKNLDISFTNSASKVNYLPNIKLEEIKVKGSSEAAGKTDALVEVSFLNSEQGEEKFYLNSPEVIEIYYQFSKYSSKDNPNITKKEQLEMRENVYERFAGYYGDFSARTMSMFDRLMKLYSEPDSEGGKEITPEEQQKFLKIFRKHTKVYDAKKDNIIERLFSPGS